MVIVIDSIVLSFVFAFFFFLFCKREGRSLMHVSPSLLLFCDNKHGLVSMTTM